MKSDPTEEYGSALQGPDPINGGQNINNFNIFNVLMCPPCTQNTLRTYILKQGI